MEAKARKAQKSAPPANVRQEFAVLQNMYDQRTYQVSQVTAAMNYYRALAAALMVHIDEEEVVLTPATVQVMMSGVIEDVARTVREDGSVALSLVFVEDDGGYEFDDNEDSVPEDGDGTEEE